MTPADATVLFVVKDGRRTEAAWLVRLEDSSVARSEEADVTSLPEADVTFTLSGEDVEAVRGGELPFSVGFMRGQVKSAGEPGSVLAVLQALDAPELEDARARLLSS